MYLDEDRMVCECDYCHEPIRYKDTVVKSLKNGCVHEDCAFEYFLENFNEVAEEYCEIHQESIIDEWIKEHR